MAGPRARKHYGHFSTTREIASIVFSAGVFTITQVFFSGNDFPMILSPGWSRHPAGYFIFAVIACYSKGDSSMSQQEQLCVSLREAAELIGISPRLLWQLVKEGKVPFVRIGSTKRGRILFPLDVLRQWLSEQSQGNRGKAVENGG